VNRNISELGQEGLGEGNAYSILCNIT